MTCTECGAHGSNHLQACSKWRKNRWERPGQFDAEYFSVTMDTGDIVHIYKQYADTAAVQLESRAIPGDIADHW